MYATARSAPAGPYATVHIDPRNAPRQAWWAVETDYRTGDVAMVVTEYPRGTKLSADLADDTARKALAEGPEKALRDARASAVEFGLATPVSLVVVLVNGIHVRLAWVGDCRAHLLGNDAQLISLTEDHTAAGDSTCRAYTSHLALDGGRIDTLDIETLPGCRILLSSPGLTDVDSDVAAHLLCDDDYESALVRLAHASQVEGSRPAAGLLLELATTSTSRSQ
ncbi:hypothetical protein [Embleya sp. NPDC059237]|uniref:hypothetical protein n=1 Tax=Embleya sp. NPDC059237 TaxID=3346784 RepID=UPI00368B9E1F